jgi:TM2 domain-containing membrane protein YozV
MEVINDKGNTQSTNNTNQESKRIVAGVLAIVIGSLGIHKFILGYTKEGIIQIVISFISCGFLGLIGLIEGIIYLTKTDEEFIEIYQNNQKGWF